MLILILKNIKEIINNKRRVFIIAVLPIIFFGLFVMMYSGETVEKNFINPIRIGIIDNDNSLYSNLLLQHYESNTAFTQFVHMYRDEQEIVEEMFKVGDLDATLIIPENFAENMMYMIHDPVISNINTQDPVKAVLLKNVLLSYEKFISSVESNVAMLYDIMNELEYLPHEISAYNAEISYELIMSAMERNQYFDYNEVINIPSTTSVNYFFIAIITLLIMYFGLYVGIDLLREREQRTFQRIEVAGCSITTFILSKLISHVLYLFLNILLWITLIGMVSNISISFGLILYILVGIIFSVSLSIFMSGLFKSQEGVLLAGNIYYFIAAVVGGSIMPLQFMPERIQRLSVFTPNYWFIRGFLFVQKNLQPSFSNGIIVSFISISILLIIVSSYMYKYLGEHYV
ncbi:ABC-type Na+ efflux pump permease subunit [Natranaerovirga pectinivora]|uniref:ABC-type Na+ efflux pump permease subunit n=1 Tax=Natranaerovirga pectinivora TaxID=682400 RepID=A0A4R3MNI2_9FIRM|nr:ABC transporter permease [Natranaerovirga pectinivora]TCT16825.1 ABC-type Na+ efflux pump permease subunit [Natranaerovirga pectinivora]